jgi:hypothetical protein
MESKKLKKPHLGNRVYHVFREEYKKAHPELLQMNIHDQRLHIAEQWKQLTPVQKQPYITLFIGCETDPHRKHN